MIHARPASSAIKTIGYHKSNSGTTFEIFHCVNGLGRQKLDGWKAYRQAYHAKLYSNPIQA